MAKREHSTNFNKSEVKLLIELVDKYRNIIENKQTDAVTNKEKEAAWEKNTVSFNAATGLTARRSKSLKLIYESIKKDRKKAMAKHRQELYRTGGGPSSAPDFTDIEEKVMAICSNITRLDARNDSDKFSDIISEPKLKQTVKVIQEALPPQTLENNIADVPDDEISCVLDKDAFNAYQPGVQEQDMEVGQTEKENIWSSWKPRILKNNNNPRLKPNQKITKVGVTAKLDQLTKSRLELVELQKEIAVKEHKI